MVDDGRAVRIENLKWRIGIERLSNCNFLRRFLFGPPSYTWERPLERSFMRIATATLILAGIAVATAVAADWPQFRGPRGDGHAEATKLPITWNDGKNIAWQTEIPGRGWSSPIVLADRIWLTTAESLALPTKERDKRLADLPYVPRDLTADASVTVYALELDAASGKLLRQIELFTVDNPPVIHANNSYASPTPIADGQRLYCHFGSLGTCALELSSGKVVWQERYAVEEITGSGGSPVLWNDLLIFACDGADEQFVLALDKATGKVAWSAPRPPIDAADGKLRRSFSTPLVVAHAGREQIVVPAAQWACSYDPASGKELWRVNIGDGHALVPRPVFQDGIVYVCTGFMKPQLWAIRAGGSGDVSDTHVAWTWEKQVPEISSPLVAGGEIYFVSSLGVVSCLDARTGEQLWQHRLGGNFAASPLLADGKLYFTSQEGITTVVKPGREYEELAKNQLFGQTMASLAVCGDGLLIRTSSHLYCVRSKP
jgi:outer membrane protein assembly factor BamB